MNMEVHEALAILMCDGMFGAKTPKPLYDAAYKIVMDSTKRTEKFHAQFGDLNGDNS